MEQLNRIELIGIVGAVRTHNIADKVITRISVATNYAYKDKDGCYVIETTWHNVTNFGECVELGKGDSVHIVGRLRQQRYVDANGNDRISYEIVASSVEKIEEKVGVSAK